MGSRELPYPLPSLFQSRDFAPLSDKPDGPGFQFTDPGAYSLHSAAAYVSLHTPYQTLSGKIINIEKKLT